MKIRLLSIFIVIAAMGLQGPRAQAQDDSGQYNSRHKSAHSHGAKGKNVRGKKNKNARAAMSGARRKGETVNQYLQQVVERTHTKNATITKQNLALPEAHGLRRSTSPVPLGEVKPPRSNDLLRESDTDEQKLEAVTEQGIEELYKLTQQYSRSPNRGELWLRLAELYVEKSKYIEFRKEKEYDDKLALFQEKKGPKPALNLDQAKEYNLKAVKLYEFYLHDFPTSPKADQAEFFLGYNYVELGQVKTGVAWYQKLTKEHPNSPYVSEAHFALGEYYFDNDKWADALKSYANVLKNQRARLFTFALYKIAWCQYRMGRAGQGLKTLEQVVALSRRPEGGTDLGGRKPISKIRLGSEALKDIVLFYVDVGNYKGASDYFYHIGGERAQWIMLEKLAYLYSDQGRKQEAYYVFKQLLDHNPTAPKAFDYQYQIVQNFSTFKNQAIYKTELYTWIDNYGPESAWAQANATNKKLLEDSYTLRESALRNYVLLLHKNAQNTGKRGELVATRQAYELYLTKFPNSAKVSEMHFFYGELLYSLGDYPNAAKEYQFVADHDPKGKYFEQAVLDTLLALEKGLKTDDQIKQLVGDSLEPVPFGANEAAFVAAAERYIKALPHGDKIVEVKFKVGRLHYAYNHFDDAISIFREITQHYAKTQYAVYAANLILDIYNLRKDYLGLAREGKALMHNRALIEAGFQTDVSDLVQKATFKRAQDLEVQKDYAGSAKAFADFAHSYPGSPLATSAAFNAGVNYERAHKIPEAITFYTKVVNSSGKDKLHQKSFLLLAHLFEQTAQYKKAAVQFEKYARDNPKDKQTPDLLYDSAVIRDGYKEYGQAKIDYMDYFNSTHRKDRFQALFAIAKIDEKKGLMTPTKEAYQKYLDAGGHDPDKVVEALFKIGDIEERLGHKPQAEKSYRRTVATARSFEERGKPAGKVWAAEAKFRLTDQVYQDFLSLRIPANPKRQAEVVKNKLALLTRLAKQLAEVIKYDEGNMVIASLTKLGQAYEHMSKSIYKAPVPKGLNKQEMDAYEKGVDQIAKPLQDQAIQNYTAAINKSYEINFYNKWTKIALDAMAQYQPDKYAEPIEQVIPVARTDDMGLQQ